ncbi:hypothetical protein K469DRAFT_167173 [Zopfia rhizophila CBS 207.26]|uniref:Uncharacterized protein n=1 Tax=Zopfia rhizophila CBS 207.26 TaxID=1314779 RepID=A0A6A6D627_9PEZI|nr:hypothetical protein K469DRAFT_167173 [Zopfia rhizophila CBS 207.26]
MLAECAQYKKERSCWSTQLNNGDADTKRWERFVCAAKTGGELRKQSLAPSHQSKRMLGYRESSTLRVGLISYWSRTELNSDSPSFTDRRPCHDYHSRSEGARISFYMQVRHVGTARYWFTLWIGTSDCRFVMNESH